MSGSAIEMDSSTSGLISGSLEPLPTSETAASVTEPPSPPSSQEQPDRPAPIPAPEHNSPPNRSNPEQRPWTRIPGATRNQRTDPASDVFTARMQLSEAFFRRVATSYARGFPQTARRIIEFGFLIQAFIVLAVFIHLHLMFVRSPITCLDKLRTSRSTDLWSDDTASEDLFERNHYAPGYASTRPDPWPRDGVLRVEVIPHASPHYSLSDSYAKEFYAPLPSESNDESQATDGEQPIVELAGFPSMSSYNKASPEMDSAAPADSWSAKSLLYQSSQLWHWLRSLPAYSYVYVDEVVDSLGKLMPTKQTGEEAKQSDDIHSIRGGWWKRQLITDWFHCGWSHLVGMFASLWEFCRDCPHWFYNMHVPVHEDNYIVEYALESGFLRLSPATRKRLNITIKLVVLDPSVDPCFGSTLSRFLMDEFLGYDDLLLGSIKHLATSESVKGHLSNVVTGQHYKFISSQTTSRSSYLVSILAMLLFTFCVSVLLRYSSHQLVLVVADLLQMFENNIAIGIPATPFMTVILALVAIETIMTEFFGDSFTAFYVILIVSICDQYEAIFCRMEISRRYWPRFFYLYHFAFYAYHYRFNGQFSSMALWVSWLFTLHSMIYFFHHYELPNLLDGWELRDILADVGPDQIITRIQIQVGPQPWPVETPANTDSTTSLPERESNRDEMPEVDSATPEVESVSAHASESPATPPTELTTSPKPESNGVEKSEVSSALPKVEFASANVSETPALLKTNSTSSPTPPPQLDINAVEEFNLGGALEAESTEVTNVITASPTGDTEFNLLEPRCEQDDNATAVNISP